ncbi:MAG: TrmH family RNA methyltransferase, partial [Chloroflexi bacterium]|nr:TrmH family RNA methyltransferase [Chloroflexota bacterium]
ICAERSIPISIADRAISRLSHSENTYAIGVFRKYDAPLHPTTNHLALVNPSDTGNLGTIIRAMLGFGLADLAVIRPAVDAFDPKVVRASMGAVFRIRLEYFADFSIYDQQYRHHNYPFMTDGQATLGEVAFIEPFTLVFGNESAGLPATFHQVGTSVRIPQTAQVDSLNLAVSVGIGLYQAAQQTR